MKDYFTNLRQNKKALVLSIIALLAIILLLVGATYAFFQAQFGAGADANVNVTTNTVDQLSFRMFNNTPEDTDPAGISITANQDNFNETDRQNVTGTTYGTATFTANNKTANDPSPAEINKTYNMYLDISENDFEYTTTAPDQKAELILTIMYSPTGNDADLTEYTAAIEGLNRTTVEGITGYDVTKAKGLIKIAEDYEIKALSGATTTHKWKITLTFVNLDSNQNANTDKTFSATLLMQKDKVVFLADHIKSLYTVDGENGLYLHDADLANGAGDNSLRYAGDGYALTEKGSQTYTSIYGEETSLIKAKNATLEEYATVIEGFESLDAFLTDYGYSSIEEMYSDYGVSTEEDFMIADNGKMPQIYYLVYDTNQNGYKNIFQAKSQASKDGFIRELNFVCFGTNITPCPDDNLYRIIGVFNELNVDTGNAEERVKLIKAYEAGESVLGKTPDFVGRPNINWYIGKLTSIPRYYWNGSSSNGSNIWPNSLFNTETLNGTYITKLGQTWSNKIAKTRWQTGGGTLEQLRVTPKEAYQNEVGTPVNNTTHDANVGLMYISEYAYAASPTNWTTNLLNYDDAMINNWMYLGINEWTISRESSNTTGVFSLNMLGKLINDSIENDGVVRPTFSLMPSVTYVGGEGTVSNPFTIGM